MARKIKRSPALKRALKRSRSFHGFKPRRIRNINFEPPKALVLIGETAQINYVCDKFDGKVREYYHKFDDRSAALFTTPGPQTDGKNVLIIIGNFDITAEGIVG